jgi:hypothetical protein
MKIWRVFIGLWVASALGVLAGTGPTASIQSIQPLGDDEVVTIINGGASPLSLTGWRLESSNALGQEVKETFWFPRGCLLPAGGTLRVHSGPAAQSWEGFSCNGEQIDLSWTEVEVWNDEADVAWLRNSSGELVDLYTYTAPSAAQPPARPEFSFKPQPEESCCPLRREAERCCPPASPLPEEAERCCACPATGGCCTLQVILVSIEPLYNRSVGENWRFFAAAGSLEPPIFRESLPQVLYEERIRGETFVQIGAGAVEEDRLPDRGWVQQEVRLFCPLSSSLERTIALEVPVRENEGCYSGCTALWRFTFKITVEPGVTVSKQEVVTPHADFTVAPPGEQRVGDTVTLDASASQGDGLSYAWDFDGDGQADATGAQASYRLVREGMNLITLTVTDRLGRSDSLTRGIGVGAEAVQARREEGLDLGLFWLTLPALAVGYFLAMAFRG